MIQRTQARRLALLICMFCGRMSCGPAWAAPPEEVGGIRSASFARDAARRGGSTVEFRRQPPQVGDQLQQRLSVELDLQTMVRQGSEVLEQGRSTIRRRQRRQVTTTDVSSGKTVAVLVRYKMAQKQQASGATDADLDEPSPTSQPVEGKSYRCRRDNEELEILDREGRIPPLAEYEIVAQHMESLGRLNPLAEFLAGHRVRIGETIELPNDVAEKLLGLGDQLGEVTRFELQLDEVATIDDVRCAVFGAHIDAASFDSSQMRLQLAGSLAIDPTTCRAMQADLSGPIGMTETRGSLSATYQMSATGKMSVSIGARYDDVVR